jgi:hypothetical protein
LLIGRIQFRAADPEVIGFEADPIELRRVVQQCSVSLSLHRLENFAHRGFFVNDLIIVSSIADPSQFSSCLSPLSNDSQHGDRNASLEELPVRDTGTQDAQILNPVREP